MNIKVIFNRQHALAGRCGCRVTESAGRAPVTAPDHDELTRFTSPWPWPFMVACKIRFEARGGWTRCALTESQFSCSPKAFSCTYARVTHLPNARQCTTPYARAFFGSSLRSLFMRHMLSLFSSSPPPPLALSVRHSSALHLADTSLCPLLCRCAILHCRSLLSRLAVLLISLCLAASLPPCNGTLDISHIRPTGCSPLSRFFIAARALAPSDLVHASRCLFVSPCLAAQLSPCTR